MTGILLILGSVMAFIGWVYLIRNHTESPIWKFLEKLTKGFLRVLSSPMRRSKVARKPKRRKYKKVEDSVTDESSSGAWFNYYTGKCDEYPQPGGIYRVDSDNHDY